VLNRYATGLLQRLSRSVVEACTAGCAAIMRPGGLLWMATVSHYGTELE
jgi:hypothetical protein